MSLLPEELAQLHLAAIVASSEDAIISKDPSGTITSWNVAAERIFGYSEAEAIGQPIRLIVPPERIADEEDVLRRIRAGELVEHYETDRIRKDGERVHVSLAISPIRTRSGSIFGALTIARDVGRAHRAQRDAMRLAAIVDSSADAIVSKDLDGIVTSWNHAAETMFGYSASEMIGQSIRMLLPSDRQGEEEHVLARIRRGERVEHYETIRRRKDGQLFPVSLTVSPILDPNGVVIGASKIAHDITERVRTDQERRRLLGIAQDASRLRDEFLATLSHELRTPLNAILGYARMMRSGVLGGDKLARAVDTVARNATSLAQIVEDLLDVSSIIAGKIRLNIQSVALPAIIRESLETVRPAVEAKGIRVTTTIADGVTVVMGDPARLQQIMWNLLSNAVKFTPRGGRIVVEAAQNDAFVDISVTDTGIGIAPEFLPYVFDRFRQADAGISRAHGGLGLGLAITRHLVELQGGRIVVSSDGINLGATFCVELPIKAAASPPHPGTAKPAVSGERSIDALVPCLHGMRILAVDDDADALALVQEILQVAGATVIPASSALEALDLLEREVPHALVADLGMPGLTGFDLIERVRTSTRREIRALPAVALTAYARSEDRVKSLQAGFDTHLAKPVDPGLLMSTIAALAGRAPVSE